MPRTGLFMDMRFGYGNVILQGIVQFERSHPDWDLELFDEGMHVLPSVLASWDGDGVIGTFSTPEMIRAARRFRGPAVNVTGMQPETHLPSVTGDDEAIGRMAAQYLMDRGFKHLAIAGGLDHPALVRRCGGFVSVAEARGLKVPIFNRVRRPASALSAFLTGQQSPLGLFCTDDRAAVSALRECRQLKLEVPDDVAILGAGNEQVVCELASPTLSSVDGDLWQRGQTAARLLEQLLRGERPREIHLTISPREVVTRQSTNIYAIDDPAIVKALRYIRENLGGELDIAQIAQAAGLSRRSLELRLRKIRGRTVREEIWHHRITEARRLLRRGEGTITDVAMGCGFSSSSTFSIIFRRETGMTPREFRSRLMSDTFAMQVTRSRG